jgi:hypothetical protein
MFTKPGRRNFEKCIHKRVVLEDENGLGIIAASLVCPKVEDDNVEIRVTANDITTHGKSNSLAEDVIRPRNMSARYSERSTAESHIAIAACSTICNGCPFVKLTPVEVSLKRTEIAEQRLEIALLDMRRHEAEAGILAAHQEIAAIESHVATQFQPQPDMLPQ